MKGVMDIGQENRYSRQQPQDHSVTVLVPLLYNAMDDSIQQHKGLELPVNCTLQSI